MNINQKTQIPISTQKESVEMEFVLEGALKRVYSNSKLELNFDANTHSLSYLKPEKATSYWTSPSNTVKVFQINITPSFFLNYLKQDTKNSKLLSDFKDYINTNKITYPINPNTLTISSKMHQIIQQIIHCDKEGMIRRVYLESRILYLLSLQIQQFIDFNTEIQETRPDIETLEKIASIKTYLENNVFKKDITLTFLSRKFGTNEYTLKNGFRVVYGTSVIKYFRALKLNASRELLTNTNLSITEIADKIGYKNARHFSTAFKKQFGVTPRDLRKL